MDIQTLISTCSNSAIKSLLAKLIARGDILWVYGNDNANVKGQYVVGYGGYTVTRRSTQSNEGM
ncbi:hypothetical protein [Thalassotalea marina]|uniref:Uncharacterized protein n=1 Tax=Thalassotalea marina TaxID=1673741 RepID=A0A919EP57_9GAMM|nr:hypothetical protein [Thalassotalea marina]GHG07207.1 hypothetical protein GCM10017161_41170 [Thalassotalea marina]